MPRRGQEAGWCGAEQDSRHLAQSQSRSPRLRPRVCASPRPAQPWPGRSSFSPPSRAQTHPSPQILSPARPSLPAGSRVCPGDDERRINGAQGRQRCLPAALSARAHRHRAAATRCAARGGRGGRLRAGRAACWAVVAQDLLPPRGAASREGASRGLPAGRRAPPPGSVARRDRAVSLPGLECLIHHGTLFSRDVSFGSTSVEHCVFLRLTEARVMCGARPNF